MDNSVFVARNSLRFPRQCEARGEKRERAREENAKKVNTINGGSKLTN